jgi:hypothetical protein
MVDKADLEIGDYILIYNKNAKMTELFIGKVIELYNNSKNFADMCQLYSNTMGWFEDDISIYLSDTIYLFEKDDINWLVMEIV